MIRLDYSVDHVPPDRTPYCVRVEHGEIVPPGSGAAIMHVRGETAEVVSAAGTFSFGLTDERHFAGDVLLVHPERGRMHRIIRAGANSNTIMLTEECDQRCIMCSQPPRQRRYDYFDLYLEAVRLAPRNAVLGISGGEPTLLKRDLFAFFLKAATHRPDIRFHVLSNGQHLDAADQPALRELSDRVMWGIPLYAPTAAVHDAVVAKPGAFGRVLDSLDLLIGCGAPVELRTVVLQQNFRELPRLAEYLATHFFGISHWAIMQLERFGYGRLNWSACFVDTSTTFSRIASAVSICDVRGLPVVLYNFPLCTVPDAYRSACAPSISDWKRKYLAPCATCALKSSCGGVFEWYREGDGFRRMGA